MTGTVTTDQVLIDGAEATTNWAMIGTWAASLTANNDLYIQGSNALIGRVSAASAWAHTSTGGGINFSSGGKHIYIWLKNITWPSTDTSTNGGLRVTVSSDTTPTLSGTWPNAGPTNSKSWYVGGSDTDSTDGFVCYVFDPNSAANLTIGTPNVASVQRIGMGCDMTQAVGSGSVKPYNIVIDAVRYGTGLTITQGTAGTPVTMTDIYSADKVSTNAYGVVTSQSNIYFVAGKLLFGTAAQVAVTYFSDKNQVIVFQKFPVAASFYELKSAGSATFGTTVQFGTITSGVVGGTCSIKGAGDPASTNHAIWTLTANDVYSTWNIYSANISEMASAILSTTVTINGCNFNNCGTITPAGATITNTTFRNLKTTAPITATYAMVINATTDVNNKITASQFINCNRAFKITSAGTYTFDGLKFSNNTYDIENSSTGAVTINCINGANPATYINTGGGSTTINNSVALTITVVDVNNNPIVGNGTSAGARVAVYDATSMAIIISPTYTNASGQVTGTFNYISNTNIVIRVRLDSAGGTRYLPIDTSGVITSQGYTATITMVKDTVATP